MELLIPPTQGFYSLLIFTFTFSLPEIIAVFFGLSALNGVSYSHRNAYSYYKWFFV